jgi:hypothetical protein
MTYFNPQGPPALPPARREAARRQLEQVVTGSAKPRRWSRPAVIAVSVTAVALGTGAAAVAYAEFQPITSKTEARCYPVASTDGGVSYMTIATLGKNGRLQDVYARGVCADLWQEGFLRPDARGISRSGSSRRNRPVPRLVVCAMPDGTAAVFPGNPATCAKLGLPQAAHP